MIRLVLLVAFLVSIAAALTLPTIADDTKTVNASVTPKIIAVNVSPTSFTYGSVSLGTNNAAPTDLPDSGVTASNTGTVIEDFKIKGSDSSPGTWDLVTTAPGANQYRHRFGSSPGDAPTALTELNQDLANDVVPGSPTPGSTNVYFRLDMPASSTSTATQTLPIMIVAIESTGTGPN